MGVAVRLPTAKKLGLSPASFVALASAASGAVGEVDGAFLDPADEGHDVFVIEDGLDGVEVAREFGLGEDGVDFRMAGPVEDRDRTVGSAFEFWGEMMATLEMRRDFTVAKRTDFHAGRIVGNDRLNID